MGAPYNPDDMTEERLAGYFEEIYAYLSENYVPDDRLPSPWHILSHLIMNTDYEAMRGWLDDYVERESDEPDEDMDEFDGDDERTNRKVSFLRPVPPSPNPESDDGQEEDGT